MTRVPKYTPLHPTAAYERARHIIINAAKRGATELDLSGMGLLNLPPEIGKLTSLTKLILFGEQLTALPKEIGLLTALEDLELDSNRITFLPPEIGQLKALTLLNLSSNRLTSLPKEIGQLRLLKELYLSNNSLSELPSEIGELTELGVLDLSRNRLIMLPRECEHLTNLEDLNLFANEILEIPPGIAQLKWLTILDVSSNALVSLPKEIGQLGSLRILDLESNQIKSLIPEIGQIQSLEQLNISSNQLSRLPNEIGELSNLNRLVLNSNELRELPEGIGRLGKLSSLWLVDNQLYTLPVTLVLLRSSLGYLGLHGNDSLRLPREVLGQDAREKSAVRNCPALLDYYFSRQQGVSPLNEVKLLLIGRGGVGKTATMNRLVGKGFIPGTDATLGIEITDFELAAPGGDPVRVHGWDFMGQTIGHGLHRFFLSNRSVYLLVLSGREDTSQEDAEYWLKLMEAYTKDPEQRDAPPPPVLMVLNQWEAGLNRAKVDRKSLEEKFPWIAGWVETDCQSGLGFTHGKTRLPERLAQIVGTMDWVRMGFPASWHLAKEHFSRMKATTGKDYVSFAEFQEHCVTELGVPKEMVRSLAVVLHRLGIALNYGEDARLCDTTVLNPHWVTDAIYKTLLRAPRESDAVMTLDHVAEVLPKEPPHMRAYVVELMRRFDLAFPLPDKENTWLVPARLPETQPPGITEEFGPQVSGATRLRFTVNPLPKMILPSFVTRTHILSDDLAKVRWANGAVLELGKAKALVKADHADRTVTITLIGYDQDRPTLASVCRRELADLFKEIPGLNPKEELEVRPGVWADVKLMERLEAKGKGGSATMPVLIGDEPEIVMVRDELNKISPPKVREVDTWKPSVFISYSHSDERFKDELVMRLKIIQAAGLAGQVWTDRMLEPGEKWDHGITQNLENADLVLLLLSNAAMASSYIQKVEVKRALEHDKAGTAVVVPIILERCQWNLNELKDLQALPKDAKPLREWRPRNAGWFNVMEQLKEKIGKMGQRRGGSLR